MALSESLRPSILFWYGQFLTLLKRHSGALKVFRMVTRENPRHQQAWSCIGFLLAEREEFQPAIDAFERALALDAADAPSHFNVAFILQRIGRHEEAIRRFERTLEVDGKVDRAWYGMGLSLAHLGRLEEAAAKFQEAARLQPFNPYAGYQLAGVWHRLGRRDKVRAEYERIKGFDPKVAERIRIEFGVQPK
jgi:tetratricopeptide (TPR) repeat protein